MKIKNILFFLFSFMLALTASSQEASKKGKIVNKEKKQTNARYTTQQIEQLKMSSNNSYYVNVINTTKTGAAPKKEKPVKVEMKKEDNALNKAKGPNVTGKENENE